jgi:ABC-type transporter Mla maintaining outer membrane lipid asymmetry permease subunit MlaE
MDRHTETWVFILFLTSFFVSKILGPSPYNTVGDIGNRRFIVTVCAIIYSLGMVILNVSVLAYGLIPAKFVWKNYLQFF